VWVHGVIVHHPIVGFGVDNARQALQPFAALQSIAKTTG
jgi:hypothetical protein